MYIYRVVFSITCAVKEGYRLYDIYASYFVHYLIPCEINNVLAKHKLDTLQRKGRNRTWHTMELFYIDVLTPLACWLDPIDGLTHLHHKLRIYHLSNCVHIEGCSGFH